MRALARLAGVNQSTVSRALRHHSRIGDATRQRVLRIAKQHGYAINPLVSACMALRKRVHGSKYNHTTLAYLTNYPPGVSWRQHDTFVRNYNGANAQAERRGYRLEEFPLNRQGLTAQRTGQILRARNIPGVIIAPLYRAYTHLDFPWEHFGAVAIGFSLEQPPVHFVGSDHYHGLLLAWNECRRQGAKRPALAITNYSNERVRGRWLAAYLFAQQSCAAEDRPAPFLLREDDVFDQALFRRWLEREKPDALIGLPLFGPPDAWKEFCRTLPLRYGWASLDVKSVNGEEAGIYQNHERIGAAAVDLLIGLVEQNQRGSLKSSQTMLLEGTWVDGRGVRPLRNQRRRGKVPARRPSA
jgi:DNA-binding LacI/PurR family transcriptional regulator